MHKRHAFENYSFDPKLYQLDFYGNKRYQGIHQTTNIPIHIKMIPLKHSYMCIKSLPDETKNQIDLYSTFTHPYFCRLVEAVEKQNHIYVVSERGVLNFNNYIGLTQGEGKIFQIMIDLLIIISFIRSKGHLHWNFVASSIEVGENNLLMSSIQSCFLEAVGNNKIKQIPRNNYEQMPPEYIQFQQFTQKSLVWNFGIILYRLVYKKYPFEGKTKQQILSKMQNGLHIPRTNSHPLFSNILMGCLRRNAMSRFSLNQLLRYILTSNQLTYQFQQILAHKIQTLEASYTLPQSQWMFSQYGSVKEILIELDFIRFLGRLCFLTSKIEVDIDLPPLVSMTQYVIRCRLCKLRKNSYWTRNKFNKKLQLDMHQISENYSNGLSSQSLQKLSQSQYTIFRLEDFEERQIVYLNYQAQLRKFICQLITYLYEEELQSLGSLKYTIYSLDFAISLFLLNQDIIEQGVSHNWKSVDCHDISQLCLNALESDVKQIFKNLVKKAINFNLLDQNPPSYY